MIGNLVPYLNKIRRSNQSNDLVDRLNYQYTALLVAVGAVTLAATQYVGKPIQCWVPAQFTGAWEKYAETFCFIKGSYFLPDDANPDDYYMSEDKREVGYYQWVPIVLAFQAFLFYLPCLVWQAFNTSSGINVKEVLENSAKIKKNLQTDDRTKMVQKAAGHIKDALELQRDLKKNAGLIGRIRKSGYFLTVLYLFSKLLFVCNMFVQFIIFNQFLGTDNTWWGWEIFTSLVAGQSWKETGHFPRVTLCDFNVRVLGAIHRWSVQCVLMINMYTEKIYVFLWFWFILIGFITIISLVYWFLALVIRPNQREFVEKYLRCKNCIGSSPSISERTQVDSFVKNFLTADGVFLLRLIQTNGGDLMVGEICEAMYSTWTSRKETSIDDAESPDTTSTLPR